MALMLLSSSRNIVYADLDRWGLIYRYGQPRRMTERLWLFANLMTWFPQYRNVFYLRVGLPGKIFSVLCRPLQSLDLGQTNIGPGFFVMHGNDTYVAAVKIGKNCWINQQVVVGYGEAFELLGVYPKLENDTPSIGDNVTIYAGAKVLGRVTIGDNAKIGANSVVLQDVPANSTVMGVPAKVIWHEKTPTEIRE
jgi:serine O-acetyltransferase